MRSHNAITSQNGGSMSCPPEPPPQIVTIANQSVTMGGPAFLHCQTQSMSRVDIRWLRFGHDISRSPNTVRRKFLVLKLNLKQKKTRRANLFINEPSMKCFITKTDKECRWDWQHQKILKDKLYLLKQFKDIWRLIVRHQKKSHQNFREFVNLWFHLPSFFCFYL